MKYLFFIIGALLFAPLQSEAQLTDSSELLKSKYPIGYSVVRANAVEDWAGDNSMIVYNINKECDSFIDVMAHLGAAVESVDSDYFAVIASSFEQWGEGVASNQILNILKESENPIGDYFALDCTWSMVLYNIEKLV